MSTDGLDFSGPQFRGAQKPDRKTALVIRPIRQNWRIVRCPQNWGGTDRKKFLLISMCKLPCVSGEMPANLLWPPHPSPVPTLVSINRFTFEHGHEKPACRETSGANILSFDVRLDVSGDVGQAVADTLPNAERDTGDSHGVHRARLDVE